MPPRVSRCLVPVAVSLSIAAVGLGAGAPRAIARPLYALDGQTARVPTPPSMPTGLSMAKVSAHRVTLRWAEPVGQLAVRYSAYVNGKRVATLDRTRYEFTSLRCGKSYRLAIGAYDASGHESPRAIKSVKMGKCSNRAGTTKGVLNSEPPTAITGTGGTLSTLPASGGTSGGTSGGSSPTLTLLPPIDVLPPAISGTAQVGSTLSATQGSWSNGPTGYAYQWQDCNSSGSGCASISGRRAVRMRWRRVMRGIRLMWS